MDIKYKIFNAGDEPNLTIFYNRKRFNLAGTEFISEYINSDDADELALNHLEASSIMNTIEWNNDEIDTDAN